MKNRFSVFNRLDGRHKLAVVGALVCWVLSVYFSFLGFRLDNQNMVWVGWFLAGIVTIVELVFNSSTSKLPLTLIVVGILCYGYGIWTNVVGFWSLQHTGVPFVAFSGQSIMSWFIGTIMEVLPEPLFMWGIMSKIDGDFLGNIAGLWSGELDIAKPESSTREESNIRYKSGVPESIRKVKSDYQSRPREDISSLLNGMKNKSHRNEELIG